jgi:DNA-binding transcriptional regulator YdaS (Cro superfamily)
MDTKLLTQGEAAELLGVSPSTLNCWRAQRRGPAFVRLSTRRCVRYKPEDLRRWIEAHRIVPPDAANVEERDS